MLILLYGCTTWTLTKRMEKKIDSTYTRMLWAILNKSWRQYPIKQQMYGHLPPITKSIKVRRTRHAFIPLFHIFHKISIQEKIQYKACFVVEPPTTTVLVIANQWWGSENQSHQNRKRKRFVKSIINIHWDS